MNTSKKQGDAPFSVSLFAFTVSVTLIIYFQAVKFFAPVLFTASIERPLWQWLTVFVIGHIMAGFAEHPFHRYLLHNPVPFFERLYSQHTLHHGLTNVTLISLSDSRGRVFNHYPILEEKQHEASYFPWFALGGFLIFSLPMAIPFQMWLSKWPILLGSACSIALSIVLYEIVHMIEHLSFETFWKPRITHPVRGKWWTSVYCFHLRHHADKKVNQNVGGAFGFPVGDFVLGTYAPWPHAFVHGEIVERNEFEGRVPTPCFLIRWLDSLFIRTPEKA